MGRACPRPADRLDQASEPVQEFTAGAASLRHLLRTRSCPTAGLGTGLRQRYEAFHQDIRALLHEHAAR